MPVDKISFSRRINYRPVPSQLSLHTLHNIQTWDRLRLTYNKESHAPAGNALDNVMSVHAWYDDSMPAGTYSTIHANHF